MSTHVRSSMYLSDSDQADVVEMRGSRKFCQRGSDLDNVFLVDGGREDPNSTKSRALSARQRNAI